MTTKYLLLNPFGVPAKQCETPGELESYIFRRFGGADEKSMNEHTGDARSSKGAKLA